MAFTKDLSYEQNQKAINLALNGNNCLNKGDNYEAIRLYNEALNIASDYVEALYNIGIAHRNIKNYQEAVNYLNLAIKLKPNYYKAHWAIAEIYNYLGNSEKANYHDKVKNNIKTMKNVKLFGILISIGLIIYYFFL